HTICPHYQLGNDHDQCVGTMSAKSRLIYRVTGESGAETSYSEISAASSFSIPINASRTLTFLAASSLLPHITVLPEFNSSSIESMEEPEAERTLSRILSGSEPRTSVMVWKTSSSSTSAAEATTGKSNSWAFFDVMVASSVPSSEKTTYSLSRGVIAMG